MSAGIYLRSLYKGLVPIYEVEAARQAGRYSLEHWYSEMSEMERALVIARRRIENQMKNLQSEAEAEQLRREANKNRKT